MKNMIITGVFAIALTLSIGLTSCEEKKGKVEADKHGVEIEGKKGGELEVDKNGLKIEGKDGGKLEVDKKGVEVEGKDK